MAFPIDGSQISTLWGTDGRLTEFDSVYTISALKERASSGQPLIEIENVGLEGS